MPIGLKKAWQKLPRPFREEARQCIALYFWGFQSLDQCFMSADLLYSPVKGCWSVKAAHSHFYQGLRFLRGRTRDLIQWILDIRLLAVVLKINIY